MSSSADEPGEAPEKTAVAAAQGDTSSHASADVRLDPAMHLGKGMAGGPGAAELKAIEEKYDEVRAMRELTPATGQLLRAVAIVFAVYHYYTAGFGLPVDHWHMGWHLSGLFVLTYAFVPVWHSERLRRLQPSPFRIGNVPLLDWTLMILGVLASLYIGLAWRGIEFLGIEEQLFRQGNPNGYDIFFGTVLMLLVLDLARRTLGWILPAIILIFVAYALLGPWIPVQILQHPGTDWRQFVNNMYFPAEGIFGVTLWVVSTTVFHFVLFGVIAQRTGLGQLFVDNAMILAGRYTGGPAKVSVISSAFFGTISGSSVANTVSTGALTIPNMKRLGYPAHFAGGVEAAASAGGQITPPIMGAAAFIMAEFLEVPYTTIVIAAIVPAMLHYIGVFSVVHLTARRLGLVGFPTESLPLLGQVWRKGWANVIPLVALLFVLFSGYTPYMAAFCGISLAIITGCARVRSPATLLLPLAFIAFAVWKYSNGGFELEMMALLCALSLLGLFNPDERIPLGKLFETVELGTKYALAVGAAAAAVGLVIGVINTTGIGFRVGFMVTSGAANMADALHPLLSFGFWELVSQPDLQLFLSLCLIAIACILMGAGIPTTALYILLVSVAQPALAQLGVPPIASHMFVLYYGVVAEITPPVCTSAYAAAAIANSNPFRTGIAAFSLGLGKVVAPMAFVYAPVLLIVSETGFHAVTFAYAAGSAILAVFFLSCAVAGFLRVPMGALQRVIAALAGLVLLAPSWQSDLVGLAIAAPVVLLQWRAAAKAERPVTPAAA